VRDHRRILGSLFIAWAVLQAVAAVAIGLGESAAQMTYPAVFWVSTALMILVYGWAGLRLRQRDPRVRFLAIVLSALTVLSFPFGTVLGAYGLWALLHKPKAEVPA
jgi:uncharacterized Tic20 family protein